MTQKTQKQLPNHNAPEDLELQNKYYQLNRGKLFCFGFSLLKRGYIQEYLASPGNTIRFVRSTNQAMRLGFDENSTLVVWSFKEKNIPETEKLLEINGGRLLRMEDGFIRSAGLGTDLNIPASLVVDSKGIYFDPTHPSDLEMILESHEFSPDELSRAQNLRNRILESRVSKYNPKVSEQLNMPKSENKQVILVPGQVEDDASIQKGCLDINTNEALLAETRKKNPNAYIIFKPHPDVVSGNRQGQVSASRQKALCDLTVDDVSLADCLDMADEVHTMTSLVGFEALLRGKTVHAYGRPFYSGWGLTQDRHQIARRTRKLELDHLVAGTLLLYPRYLNVETGRFTTPEYVVSKLEQEQKNKGSGLSAKAPWPLRQLKKLTNIWKGLFYVR